MYQIYGWHLLMDFVWSVFLLLFIFSLKYGLKEKYLFGILSIVSGIVVIGIGVMLIKINPYVIKSGGWLHAKLTLLFFVFLENIYLIYILFRKKLVRIYIYNIMFWFSLFSFISAIAFSMFRPF
ncbi:hypothetical protein FE773_06455 [Caminibacter mediatlanticus TB-2]|uniref:Uncharacterized protein n=1 Tax=Caminibacter mediatlanticus TB-2 TaxID=391592 RepID=A0AAI9F322_9BACT|nr:hypothetical protein [Caminibacter mediatlanticus]EDM24186.1 hypothetical protein CMTB2_01683 [Caminibacter mediatlanticus TB-2]QCT94835.1 hypothetical protein FE773_06455 [Caminibacter mediatlanticus TB-2]